MEARDNLALCAMQILLKKEVHVAITPWQRLKKILGLSYKETVVFFAASVAEQSYAIADAMIEAKRKTNEE